MSKRDKLKSTRRNLRGKVLVLPLERHARERENTGVSRIGVRPSPAANRAETTAPQAPKGARAKLVHFICQLYRDLEGEKCRTSKESE